MEFLLTSARACSTATSPTAVHRRQGQARHRHRRRRHRHRLRRHVAAPRLQEPGAVRDPAAPARRARGRQPVAAVAQGLQAGLRPGGGGRAVRRRPAPLRHRHQALRRRRGRQRQGAADDRRRVGEERRRPLRDEGDAGQREGLAGRAGAAGDGLRRPREGGPARRPGRGARRARQRRGRRRQGDQRPRRLRRRRHVAAVSR